MWRAPLIHKNKTIARVALYGGAILLPVLVGWLISYWSKPVHVEGGDWYRPLEELEALEAVQLFQEYLRVDTSPAGSEALGAEVLARPLRAAGFEVHIEKLGERHANLWAILEGEEPEALVLHNHIDVDPVTDAEEWRYPPFDGVISQPWIYGRGAFDMKSVAIAQLMAMLELKRSGVRPRRSLIFLATGDEERGSRMGARWILREHPELVSRFAAVLTEGGVVEALNPEDVKYWGTEFSQKRFVRVVACHGRRDRLEALREDLLALDKARFARRITPQVASFFREYADTRDHPQITERLNDPAALIQDGELQIPKYLQLMVRNDVVPGEVMASDEGGYSLGILLALLPGVKLEEARGELLPEWMTTGVALAFEEEEPPSLPSSIEHPIFVAIDEFMDGTLPSGEHGPMIIPWSMTDARFFRAAGIPAYGYSPFLILAIDTLQMAGRNERMALDAFLEGVDRYTELVRLLVT